MHHRRQTLKNKKKRVIDHGCLVKSQCEHASRTLQREMSMGEEIVVGRLKAPNKDELKLKENQLGR